MDRSEKRFRPLLFIKNTSGVLATKVVLVLLKMAIGILTARVLGPNGKGIFVLAIQMPGILATVSNLSLGEAIIYHIGQTKIPKHRILGTILVFTGAVTTFVCVAYFLLLPYLSATFLKNINLDLLKVSILLFPLVILDYLVFSALKGLKKFNFYNWLTLLTRGLYLCGIFTALVLLRTGVKGAVSAYVLAALGSTVVLIAVLFIFSERKISFSWNGLKSLITYGLATHIATILAELEYRFDFFILNFFLSPAHVGIYSVGVTMAQLLWYVSNSVNTVLFPEVSSLSQSEAVRFVPRVCRNVVFICSIFGLFLAVTGHYLIKILYGAKFIASYPFFLILLPGLIMDAVFRILGPYFNGTARPMLVSKVSAVTLGLNLLLNFLLIPVWGIAGAAISSVVSYSLRAVGLMVCFQGDRKVNIREFLLVRKRDLGYYSQLVNEARKKLKILPARTNANL
jgi:O-antigen/teichoic acid export membrane protein